MRRKAFYKARRGLGTIVALLAVGLEASGYIPEGTVAQTVTNVSQLAGVVLAIWGGVQAEVPLGLRDSR